mmetsp:Transcript_4536/g.6626  ORF Transcript_4536/g.6626 Transcript_4536/m.6626 type:complete len:220 (+) Transcript_4536:58-717(+)
MTFQQSYQPSSTELSAPPVNSTKAKRRMQMNPIVSVYEYDVQPLTKEEKSELYYSKNDLDYFMLEVKQIAFFHRETGIVDPSHSSRSNISEDDDHHRGIEMLIYPQRCQNKLVSRRALLKYQTYLQTKRTDITPEKKAAAMRVASEKLSSWSHLVAQETARLDSIRAYEADYLIPLDDKQVELSSYPEHTFKKKEVRRVTPLAEVDPRPFKKARAVLCS